MSNKEYIDDGVYCEFDGYRLILTTENGISVTNTIVLEPEVWHLLQEHVRRLVSAGHAAAVAEREEA